MGKKFFVGTNFREWALDCKILALYKFHTIWYQKQPTAKPEATSHYSSLKLHYNSMAPLPYTPCIPIPHASYPCHSLLALPHFCVPAHDLLKGHSSTGCFESLRKERRGEERRGEERRGVHKEQGFRLAGHIQCDTNLCNPYQTK